MELLQLLVGLTMELRLGMATYGAVLWVWPPSMGLALDLWG